MRWLMSWASAEPVEAVLLALAVLFALVTILAGIAAWRAWEQSPPSTATSGSDRLL